MRKILISIIFIVLAFGVFVWIAASPAVSSKDFSNSAILQFYRPSLGSQGSDLKSSSITSLKVVTYNIGYASGDKNNRAVRLSREEVEANLRAMTMALQKINADVLCLQEVDFQSSRSFHINQMEYLAHELGYPYGAYVVTWNKRYLPWPYWPPQNQFGKILSGQVILSRFPIEKQDLLWFDKPASNSFWYNWFYLNRVAQKVTIHLDRFSLILVNVHLEAFDPGARHHQSVKLAQWVEEEPSSPQIVAGDFNSASQNKELLSGSQKEAMEGSEKSLQMFLQMTGMKNAERKDQYSFPSWDPTIKIDQILYEESFFHLEKLGIIIDLKASDHLPVWALFKM